MKRLVSLLLVASLSVTCLWGCGGSDNASSSAKQETTSDKKAEKEKVEVKSETVELNDFVWIDNEEMKITVKDMTVGGEKYAEVLFNVTLENKTDADFTMLQGAWINGVGIHAYFIHEDGSNSTGLFMNPKETKDLQIIFKKYDKEPGTIEVTDVFLSIKAFDTANVNYLTEHLYPYGEDNIIKGEHESKETDVVLIDNEDVTVSFRGYTLGGDEDYNNVYIWVNNKSNKMLCLTSNEIRTNGVVSYSNIDERIPGECSSLITLYMDEGHLNNISFADLNDIEYKLWVLDVSSFAEETFNDFGWWTTDVEYDGTFNPEEYAVAKAICTIYADGSVQIGEADSNVNASDSSELADASETISYSLGGVQYTFPTPFSELIANGWILTDTVKNAYGSLNVGEKIEIDVKNASGGILYEVVIKNTTEETLALEQCTVVSMLVAWDSQADLKLSNGIHIGTSKSELNSIAGTPMNESPYSVYTCSSSNDGKARILAYYYGDFELEYFILESDLKDK